MAAVELSTVKEQETQGIHTWLRQDPRAFNEKFLGPHKPLPIAAVAKDGGHVIGAILGVEILDWVSVETVFLDERYRLQGPGDSMLRALEEEAKKQDATRVSLDTTSFQAEGFYAKAGYVESGRFKDFAPGVDRIFMRKDQL